MTNIMGSFSSKKWHCNSIKQLRNTDVINKHPKTKLSSFTNKMFLDTYFDIYIRHIRKYISNFRAIRYFLLFISILYLTSGMSDGKIFSLISQNKTLTIIEKIFNFFVSSEYFMRRL